MRSALPPAIAAVLFGHSPPAAPATIAHCQWVEGRLAAYNGTPTVRIWPKGTKRLLGVVSRSGASEGADVLPSNVSRMRPSFSRDVWGSFRVCPQNQARAGWMQFVVVADARRLSPTER